MSDLINYTMKGSGKPIVLIHGWAMHAEVWQGFADRLAERYMTVAVELRGHGESRALPGPYSFDQSARDVAAVTAQLGLEEVTLLGWSMGVSVILKMLEQGSVDAASLVLVSGNPSLVQRPDYAAGLAPVVVKRLRRQVQRSYHEGLRTFLDLLCTQDEHARFSADPAYLAAMNVSRCPEQEAALESLACLQTEDLRKQAARVAAPTLVVHGAQDEICVPDGGRYLAEYIRGAQLLMLPDTGHMPFVTRRAEVVVAVMEFMKTVTRG